MPRLQKATLKAAMFLAVTLYKIQHRHGPVLTRLLAQEPENRARKKWSRRRATAWRSWRYPTLATNRLQTPTLVYPLLPLPRASRSFPRASQSFPRASQSFPRARTVWRYPTLATTQLQTPTPVYPVLPSLTRVPVLPQSQNPFSRETRPQETVPQTPVRLFRARRTWART